MNDGVMAMLFGHDWSRVPEHPVWYEAQTEHTWITRLDGRFYEMSISYPAQPNGRIYLRAREVTHLRSYPIQKPPPGIKRLYKEWYPEENTLGVCVDEAAAFMNRLEVELALLYL